MAEIIEFRDAAREYKRDKEIIDLLVSGKQPYQVAEHLGISKTEVQEAHKRMMGAVPPDYRARALDLSLRTYDDLKEVWWKLAKAEDTAPTVREMATKAIMRIEDARADRVGIRQLPTRDDALDDMKQCETSTENLWRIFEEWRGTQPPTIEGEAHEEPPDE